MIKQTIAILLMFSFSLQDCGDGCLRCIKPASDNAVPECAFCDTYSNYILVQGACQKKIDLECDTLTQNGQCLQCSTNHYLDFTAQKCLQVDQQNRVDKCYYYDEKQKCRFCFGPFILQDDKCIAISQVIPNCDFYDSNSQCMQCEENYYYDSVIGSCLKLTSSPECISHSRFTCFKCEKGLILDPNYYFDSKFLFQSEISNQYMYDIMTSNLQDQPVINNDILQCRNSQITNCADSTNYKECKKCNDGYYLLSNGQCQQYPLQPIPYCEVYKKYNVCQQCIQGAIMTVLNKCKLLQANELIDKCNTYSTTARVAICTSCSPDSFVHDNRCVLRQNNNIDGCVEYDLFADKCSLCATEKVIGSDGLLCLNKISFCQIHRAFNINTTQENLVCEQCEALYYLDKNVCVAGTKQFCQIYQKSSDICVECQQRYFGAPDCKEHGDIPQCVNYSQVELNVCLLCETQNKTFRWLEKCEDLPKIENCEIYENNTNQNQNRCSKCVDGFALTQDKICANIDVNNCIEAQWIDNQEDICSKCINGMGLATTNDGQSKKSCETPFYYLDNLCDVMKESQTDLNSFECKTCKVNSIPFNFGSHHICIEENKMKFLQKAVTLIDNCEMYVNTNTCQRCAQGWFLSDDQQSCIRDSCVDNLGHPLPYSSIIVTKDSNDVTSTIQNKCKTSYSDEEEVYAPDLTNLNNEVLIGCTGKFIKVYSNYSNANVSYSNVNPANKNSQHWVDHVHDVFPQVNCPKSSTSYTINSVTDSNPITTCEAFIQNNTGVYQCAKCPFGQTGKLVLGQDNIQECISMQNCSNNRYKNILPYWEQFFSCHECSVDNQIPVIGFKSSATNTPFVNNAAATFIPFTLQGTENWTNVTGLQQNQISNNIFCMDVKSEASIRNTLHLEYTNQNYGNVIPLPNCGLAVLNFRYNIVFNNSKSQTDAPAQNGQALYCAVCAPGYKATYQGIIAVKCERIDNCIQRSTWFNGCSQCYPGFRYEYNNNQINYDSCVRIPHDTPGLDHCYAYQRIDSTDESDLSGVCVVCEKGYVLNEDNYCDQIKVPACTDGFFQAPNQFRDHINNIKFALYNNQSGSGCNNCDQGYHSLPSSMLNVNSYCIESSYLQANQQDFPLQSILDINNEYDQSNFIDQCIRYQARFSPICEQCVEGYILRSDGKACVNNTLFPNCILFDSQDFHCVQCKSGFGLVNGVYNGCIQNEIENCQTINESIAHDRVTCLQCNDGFYLQDNKCVKGHIPNCALYQSKEICSQCEEGYWPFGMETGSQTYTVSQTYYCIKKAEQTNCKVPNFSNNLGDLRCTTCEQPYQKIVNNQHLGTIEDNRAINLSLCLEIGKIENCEKYNKELYLNRRIFKCDQCSQQNYLNSDGTQCIERINYMSSCKTYSLTEDICTECQDNYLLSDDKKQCLEYPQGIINCSQYIADDKDKFQCSQCSNQTYLSDGKCIEIPVDQQISNCYSYTGPSQCGKCNTGYFLENDKCLKINLIDCQEPLSSKECKVCNPGFRLFSDDGLNKCISLDKKNCLKFVQNSYNKCLLCKTHYYPDQNGDCQIVDDIITNCIVYSAKNKCQQCQPEYALKWDMTECISKEDFDPKCTLTVHTSIPSCNVCQAGYLLKNGRCIRFKDNLNDGCYFYSLDSDKCQMCKVQYHMGIDGVCKLNTDQLVDVQTGDDDNENTNDQTENALYRLSAILTMIIMVLFN